MDQKKNLNTASASQDAEEKENTRQSGKKAYTAPRLNRPIKLIALCSE